MASASRPATDFAAANRAMIDSQLRTSGVNEPWLLSRFGAVQREDFVPVHARQTAYVDRAVPLDGGGTLAAPLFYGRMLSEAKPTVSDRVLVVDGGSGYLPALLQGVTAKVDTIAADQAATGKQKKGDYTLLLIDGAVEQLPPSLAAALADNARVVTGTVDEAVTRLAIGRKAGGTIALLPLAEMGIPRLPAFDKPKVWSF